ncbi:hypothetical protein [Burkholderia cenocepacia]|jgi:hypothetical protein|uniref:Exported protein n=1 Tax=Burkholderia cenocepacia (strain ATCC BAA-245 / DSM 16553 / LMG 16656 / NCTC 13227 / J2315 / CF5610) TaxID=216591 RepID=B4EQI7_BURCJ|nr:hypothetical protein [Burkholderia cenocepacia]KIS45981.1 hypothetical protein NP88_7283 [Burkholderia cepacia]EPZ84586.1 hypothetical protein BURCENK562V_C0101 [Burkholderia cenocepacia K56-2Valvano]ERI28628.1 hypothetical protein BURCENBC7_AP0299 [Burkholderia cenocepacia BC7]MDI9695382.1 hypothetical protein [Burkholderia cenocepacia]ONR58993.1 hypothetical protein A8E17_15570 [Burkholderia cenocepacia]
MTRSILSIAVRIAAAVFGTALAASASAQTLASPQPVGRISDVTQFGMRPDAQFVICEGEECPPRTVKHIAQAPVARAPEPEWTVPEPTTRPATKRKAVKHKRHVSHKPRVRLCK